MEKEKGKVEENYLMELRNEVDAENKYYYEQRARQLYRKQDGSKLLEIQLRLLLKMIPELR